MRDRDGPAAGCAAAGAERYQVAWERRQDTASCGPAQQTGGPLGIKLRGFRPLTRGALVGYAVVELPSGLLLHDCPVFRSKDGLAWAALPAKAVVDRDGQQKTDVNGKRQFAPVLEWRSRGLANQFSAAVVALIERAYPGALDGGEL